MSVSAFCLDWVRDWKLLWRFLSPQALSLNSAEAKWPSASISSESVRREATSSAVRCECVCVCVYV